MATAIVTASPTIPHWRPDKAYKEATWIALELTKIPRARRRKVWAHILELAPCWVNAPTDRKFDHDKCRLGVRPGGR